jgi:ribosomal protein S13
MRFRFLQALLCEGVGVEGNQGGGGPPGNPPPVPPEEQEIKLTSKQLSERLARASKSQLKEIFGTDDVEAIKANAARLKALEEAEEVRAREAMSEKQRIEADLAKERAERAKANEELAEMRLQSHVNGVCATLGIKNTKYARYLVEHEVGELTEGKELDVSEFLKGRLEDPQSVAAFGIQVSAPIVGKPVSTSPEPGSPPPNPPPPSGGNPPKPVSEMTKAEFAAYTAAKHGATI